MDMLPTLKLFQCPNCSSAFSNRDISRHPSSSKFPLILPCHHSVCESCLHSALKPKNSYVCLLCKSQLDLHNGKDTISKLHPDVHALGILNANRKGFTSLKVKMGPSQEMAKSLSPKSPPKSVLKIQCENCCQTQAIWQCDECQLNFCTPCFDKIHKNMKSKKRHDVKKIFVENYNTLVQEGCKDHKNKPIEFYCEKDDTLTCSHCMLVGSHIGHEVKSLADKNHSCASELKSIIEEISGIEKRLRYTENLLVEVSISEKVDASEYIKTVHNHFHKLHTILQLREQYLISELETAANLQTDRIEKMRLEVSNYQKDICSIKRDAELVIENPCLAVSAPSLIKKLESFKSIPCYLLPITSDAEKKVEIDLKLDHEIYSTLQEYGSVDYTVPLRFELVSSENLPQSFCMDIPGSFSVSDIDSQSSTTFDNLSEDSLSSPSNKYGIEAAFKYKDFSRRCPEKVVVSHMQDPSCFWIQRYADQRKLNSISDAMNKWCRSREGQRFKPSVVEKGDLYLAQFSVDKNWYRGRIKKILEAGETYEMSPPGMKASVSKQVKTVKPDEEKVEVFYIDYGNTEVISLSNLLNIQPRFLSLAGLAKQCSLVDILPVGEEWSVEAIKAFRKFVQCKPVIMITYEERSNVLQVDLSQVADAGIENDVPVSVRDALVFLELAVYPGGKSAYGRRNRSESKFLPPERIRANAEISVIVSHVESPSHLYIQQVSTASYLSSLIVEMNEAYSKETNTLLHNIFVPRVGMICAAQFTLDNQWYRAQVKSLPGGANVEVQYVDFGNSEVLNHQFLRKLPDKFCKLNIQAISCKLADVTYNQDLGWSPEAKEWLTNKVSKKQLTLKSLGYLPSEDKTSVVLFYKDDDYEVCVNALMVEERLVASCGENSTEVRVKLEVIDCPVPPVVTTGFTRSLSYDSVEEEPILPILTVKPKPPKPPPPFPKSEGKHIEVHISCIKSPGAFYIRIAGEMEKRLKKLVADMQKAYKDFEMNVNEAVVGNSYAVFSEQHGQWYRGTVFSQADGKVKVQFVDYGYTEDVNIKKIHKLMDKFAADEEFAIKCELLGIIPAGGSSEWSYKSCEEFQDFVANHETLHLTCKVGKDKDTKCLPVNLYIEELNIGGALEPTKIEYKSVAEELINRGVALPLRNTYASSPIKPGNQKAEPDDSATKSDDYATKPDDCATKPDDCATKPNSCETEPSSSGTELNNCKTKLNLCGTESGSEELELSLPSTLQNKLNANFSRSNFVQSNPIKETDIPPPKSLAPMFTWKPVVYPTDAKFKGFVTNIGEDGCVHLHVRKEGGKSAVETISNFLQFKYSKTSYTPLTLPPPVGEACIAKFSVDKLWYRAEIISIYSTKRIKVNFVDYGNDEIIPLSDIRTDIAMQLFPKQCLECSISGIHIGEHGLWDEDLINFLHTQLVETIIEVEIMGPPDKDGKLPCNLVTSCGISVRDLLISMGFLDKPENKPEENKTFQKSAELRKGDVFPVCISHIDSPNILFLQRLKVPEPKSDYEKQHNKEHDSFLELVFELQVKAETFPPIKEAKLGLACCAKYSHDNQWYRCEVIDLAEDGAVVMYVDYGNSETQPIQNLRTLDSSFISFPMQVHCCKIYGIKPSGDDWDSTVKDFMVQKLCLSNQEIYAKVIVPGEMSEIELLVKGEDGEMKLVYEELLEMGLIFLGNL